VQGKGDVVELGRGGEAVVARGVLGADDGRVVEGNVGAEVGSEALRQWLDIWGGGGKFKRHQRG
jgi:hypothetical protein